MGADRGALRRQVVTSLALLAAVVTVAALVISGPPGSGYGWGSVVISCILVAVPLVAIGLMVRTGDTRFAWPTIVVAALLTFFAVAALLGNWSGQSAASHVVDLISTAIMLAAALGAIVVEVPLARLGSHTHPTAPGGPAAR